VPTIKEVPLFLKDLHEVFANDRVAA